MSPRWHSEQRNVPNEMTHEYKISKSKMAGVYLIQNKVYNDHRGNIWTTFNKEIQRDFREIGYEFCHDKFNVNKKNVLRGIHFDKATAKLVTCISGSITQFLINVDETSERFGEYEKFELNSQSGLSVLVPPGIGNAFISREQNSVYHYKLSYPGPYVDHHDQGTIRWNDPRLHIAWQVRNPILSARDQ